jgi:hypothetical protein
MSGLKSTANGKKVTRPAIGRWTVRSHDGSSRSVCKENSGAFEHATGKERIESLNNTFRKYDSMLDKLSNCGIPDCRHG